MHSMVRKCSWLIVLWVVVSGFALADGFRGQFRAAFRAGDLAAADKVLVAWEKATPKAPDFYVAKFNMLLKQAERVEVRPAAADNPPSKPTGVLRYDLATMTQAATTLQKGIALAPDRLEMRFGLAKGHEMAGQPGPLLQTLPETLEAREKNGKPWRWRDGEALPAPEPAFVPAAVEPFASAFRKQPGNSGLENGRAVAELMEKYFPQNSLGYFNMGVYYAHLNKPQEAYEKMQQADALQSRDFSTLMNLSEYAIELKHKDAAKEYLDRLRKMPNGAAADGFTAALQKL